MLQFRASHASDSAKIRQYHLYASAIIMSLLVAPAAHATGTAAGTVIQNTATASYLGANGPIILHSNTNAVVVDQVTGVAVTPLLASPAAIGNTNAVLIYQVTNTGNGNDSFYLTGTPAVAGNPFNTTLGTVAIDQNANGVYDPGVDTTLTNGAASQTLAPDASIKVFLIVSAPLGVADALASQIRLTATSATGAGAPGTFFSKKGVGNVDVVVGLSGGNASALETVVTSIANVSLTKSYKIADQYGGSSSVSGATVTYAILAHVTGSGTANSLVVTDNFPAGTTYLPGTITLNGKSLTDAADTDQAVASTTGIAVSLGNVAGSSPDNTITFQAKIN